MKQLIIAIFFFAITFQLFADKFDRTILQPTKIETSPIIDGDISDDVWENATSVTNFKSFMPDFGKDASERTIAYMAYDEDNLYFAFKCYDKEIDKIKSSITSRDNIRDEDWICVNLDTYNDQQSLTAFYVNPFGIQMDSRYMSGNEDTSIDYIWFSSGKIDSEGYTVEMQIPLKSIRYANSKPVKMSIFFERKISRRTEHVSYPELDPDKGYAMLTQLNPIEYHDLKKQTILEVLPAFTYSYRDSYKQGALTNDIKKANGHLTLKYGITSNLVLDATYNPDFSQIESDAGQIDINLRNSLYFAEKRPFFLEGSDIFSVSSTHSSSKDPIQDIVHTRTIVNPIFGLKLAGKIGKKDIISLMYAKDELPNEGSKNQYAHFPIMRYKRAFNNDGYVGAIFAARELDSTYNRVGGFDSEVRITPSSSLLFHGLVSESKKNVDQSIDKGHAIGMRYVSSNRSNTYVFTFKDISKDFNADMGYVSRTGMQIYTAYFMQKLYPKNTYFRSIDGEIFTSFTNDKFYNMWETFNYSSITVNFSGNAQFIAKYYLTTEIFNGVRYKTSGFHTLLSNQFTKSLFAYAVVRWNNAIYYINPQQGKTFRVTASIIFQPSDNVTSELDITYAKFNSDLNNEELYNYLISRFKLTYQLNKYLFFRGIGEYNGHYKRLNTDFLASFTYIPGTVIHLGYGSMYQKSKWDEIDSREREYDKFIEHNRGFFVKVSYLWRL